MNGLLLIVLVIVVAALLDSGTAAFTDWREK
jgi:hypothetical protein